LVKPEAAGGLEVPAVCRCVSADIMRKVSGNARTLQLPVKSVLEEPMLPYPINLFYKKFADFIRRFRQN